MKRFAAALKCVVLPVFILLASPALGQTRPLATASQIDINSASRDDLMTLDGIGEVRADAIIRSRPFKAKTELVDRHVIPEELYMKLADKVQARPIPVAPPPKK
jgi:competence protein ComEA